VPLPGQSPNRDKPRKRPARLTRVAKPPALDYDSAMQPARGLFRKRWIFISLAVGVLMTIACAVSSVSHALPESVLAWLSAPARFAITLVESRRRGVLPLPSRTEMIIAVASTTAVWAGVTYLALLATAAIRRGRAA
jgi:hypothetical protein